jgi:hypothetical protein
MLKYSISGLCSGYGFIDVMCAHVRERMVTLKMEAVSSLEMLAKFY